MIVYTIYMYKYAKNNGKNRFITILFSFLIIVTLLLPACISTQPKKSQDIKPPVQISPPQEILPPIGTTPPQEILPPIGTTPPSGITPPIDSVTPPQEIITPPDISDISPPIGQVTPQPSQDIRAAWVSTVWGLDFPKNPTSDDKSLQNELLEIANLAIQQDLTDLFFQVRPCADALYQSNIFPYSRFLTGTEGVSPNNNFDPLQNFVDICHTANIRLHAWINPYRVQASQLHELSSNNPAKLNPELTFVSDQKLYFNPGEPQARNLILSSVEELLINYDIDGIHFDDYFYPETSYDDSTTFAKYGKDFTNIADWRRNNVDTLVTQTSDITHQYGKLFSVSCTGVWANKSSNSLGSNTSGYESFNAIFADSRKWAKENLVDWIIPQVYFPTTDSKTNYKTVVDWWEEVCKDTNTRLIIGLAYYKFDNQELDNQLTYNDQIDQVKGYSIFRFSNI